MKPLVSLLHLNYPMKVERKMSHSAKYESVYVERFPIPISTITSMDESHSISFSFSLFLHFQAGTSSRSTVTRCCQVDKRFHRYSMVLLKIRHHSPTHHTNRQSLLSNVFQNRKYNLNEWKR